MNGKYPSSLVCTYIPLVQEVLYTVDIFHFEVVVFGVGEDGSNGVPHLDVTLFVCL